MLQREQGPPPCGGILATDTGFGKTYVIAALVKQHQLWPTLIAVPKDLVPQWITVLNAAGFQSDLRAVVEGKHAPSANSSKLVLTTVSLLQTKPGDLIHRSWGRVIVDEAHVIRNPRTTLSRVLRGLRAHARWAVTATPVQNKRSDAVALAKFVGVIIREDDTLLREIMYIGDPRGLQEQLPPLRVQTVVLEHEAGSEAASVCAELHQRHREAVCVAAVADVATALDSDSGGGGSSGSGSEDGDDEAQLTQAGSEATDDGPSSGSWQAAVWSALKSAAAGAAHAGVRDTFAAPGNSRWELQMHCLMAATHPAIYFESLVNKGGEAALDHAESAQRGSASPGVKVAYIVDDVLCHPEDACIVFYEWNAEAKLLEAELRVRSACVWRYHGGMTSGERANALMEFQDQAAALRAPRGPDDMQQGCVLLAQLRCAACGLNLQCASRAYLLRPHWNPAVEKQAIGRLYRSGQERPVFVSRLVLRGTLDEVCLARQASKLNCAAEVLGDDSMRRLLLDVSSASQT